MPEELNREDITADAVGPAERAVQDARLAAMRAQQRFAPASQIGMHLQFGPAPNELLSKLDASHLTKAIESADKEAAREDQRKKQVFWGTLLATCATFPLICYMFLVFDKPDFIEKILTLLVGAFGGYGIAKAIEKK